MPVEQNSAITAAAAQLRDDLLGWYGAHARALPWRAPPGAAWRPDPYHVWLSEVMLQQTTVAAVRPYFERFTTRWPSVAALAAAEPEDILTAWAGLGYYSRARNLIAAAAAVVRDHGGTLPADVATLRRLPGVGAYTAAAIAAFAFGANAIPLDANLERVIARVFAVETPLPAARRTLHALATQLWPNAGGGDFAQALMDLGARLCTARSPRCGDCPIAAHCAALPRGLAETLPKKPAKAATPQRYGRAWWLERDGHVWLVRRPATGLLGGMRALPGGDWGDALPESPTGAQPLGHVRHIFTHFALDLAVDALPPAAMAAVTAAGKGEWWPIATLDEAGLPTLYRRAAERATAAFTAAPKGE